MKSEPLSEGSEKADEQQQQGGRGRGRRQLRVSDAAAARSGSQSVPTASEEDEVMRDVGPEGEEEEEH